MNFKYNDPNDPQGQGLPGQQHGYTIVLGGGPQQQVPPNPYDNPAPGSISPQMLQEIHRAKMRMAHAQARNMEADMIMRSMNAIKDAIDHNALTVADGDSGSGNRPPLEPAFDEINRGKLQLAYLRMTERLINYNEFFLTKECGMPLTNEITKLPLDPKEVELPKPD
jgi:hypothetical protein